jgi:hypothetical protein
MSAQHTPGPWIVVRDVKARNYMVLRDLLGSGGQCELMKWENGQVARFGNEDHARAAIAKAEGADHV